MKTRKAFRWLGLAAGVCVGGAVVAQGSSAQLPDILGNDAIAQSEYLPDFSYAGYGYGVAPIPSFSNVINVSDHGAVADDGIDDSQALKAALAAANEKSGPVRIQFEPGRYILSDILWVERSSIVLAGAGGGKGGTEIYMPRPLNQIDDGGASDELRQYLVENDKRERQKDANLDVLFSEYSWNGGFIWVRTPKGRHATYLDRYDKPIEEIADISAGRRGQRVVTMASSAGLSVGDVVQIHWHNRAGENGPLIEALYGKDTGDLPIGSRHWELPDRPLVRQATRIEAISGNQVTIADPLLHDIDARLPAYFARWEHLSDVGIQDMKLTFPENPYFGHHNESGFNAIYFTGVHNGWIRNVTISEADSGILTDDLANVTIANVVTKGTHKAHYGVHLGNVHNVLVTGNQVFNPTEHTFSFNTQCTKSVYHDSIGWNQPTLDQHAGANHQNLYDQITVRIRPDQKTKSGSPMYYLFKAGGAGYWKPGHGRFNTLWNLSVMVESAPPDAEVTILGDSEGPDARVVGLHGNRKIALDYTPRPYTEMSGQKLLAAPSLYDWQLGRRKR